MTLVTWLVRNGRASPDDPAIWCGDSPWASHGELATRAGRIAAGLTGRAGLVPGDRVAIAMRNAPEYIEALYAIWWAGLVAVPINAKLHRKEIAFIVENSG